MIFMYPRLHINLGHLKENISVLTALCAEHGIGITGVTKVFRGDPIIAQAMAQAGIAMLGDSRVDNLRRLDSVPGEKWLIRPPMKSEVAELVRWGDASLHSEIEVIRAIDQEALRQGKRHKIILMADLGDIREGYTDYDELVSVAREVATMNGAVLYGLGVNLTCFSFIQPDTNKMTVLRDLARRIERETRVPLSVVSGGNSATLALMLGGGIPDGVNNLRLGEALLFGKERANYQFLPGTYRDVFTLECEIVELKEKPSLPWGEIGVDSYGNRPTFTDRGERRLKAVCALGKQDFDPETSTAIDPGVIVLGASSDHLMLDLTDSEASYRVGDAISLQLGYFSTMRAFTSDYVEKVYHESSW